MFEEKRNYDRRTTEKGKNVFGEAVKNSKKKKNKKKATFDMDPSLHKELRKFAAIHELTMVSVVEEALTKYMRDINNNN